MKRLNEKQWRDEKELRDAVLLKAVDTVITESEQERVLNFRISSETPDSYNDVIKADGWDLTRFEKNPVVLWAHSHREPPVGQALSIEVDGDALVASAQFADAETYAFADTVYRLLKKGFLRATSVGFFPKEWTYDEDRGGYNFISSELFEFSIVPVPANPDALALAVKDGIDCTPLREWAEKTLDMWAPDDSVALWIPRSQIEDLHKSLTPAQIPLFGVEKEYKDKVLTPLLAKIRDGLTGANPDGGFIISDEKMAEEVKALAAKMIADDPEVTKVTKTTKLGDIVTTVEVIAKDAPEVIQTLEALDDDIESLKAQVDQLTAKLAAAEKEKKEEGDEADDGDVLADVIDIQIDSHAVENEVDLAILDLDINQEELQQAIRQQLERGLMKITGKLPKEV
jgi:HK97 family phage prohead protease